MDIKKIIRSRLFQVIGTAVLFFAVGLVVSNVAAPTGTFVTGQSLNLQVTSDAREGFNAMSNIQAVFHDVSQKIMPSVVEVDVVDVVKQTVRAFNSPFDFFFGPQDNSAQPRQREYRQQGLGSGFIVRQVDNKVYILTNNHVVNNATEISVILTDKRRFDAKVVGKDDRKDLALIVFESTDKFPVVTLGDSNAVEVGDWVLAVGNPLGFNSTVTEGIISAVGRRSLPNSDISAYTDYFQTDAAINQGNSGGALLNIHGEVIGINTWIASPSGGSVGLGFAIPINNAKTAVEDFITKGKISYGWLGISGGDPNAQTKDDLGLGNRKGSFVYGVVKNSPAAAAGLQPGDYITRVNSQEITDMTQLTLTIGNMSAGSTARLDIIRLGETRELSVTIAEKPADENAKTAGIWPGITAIKITDSIRNQLQLSPLSGGLVVGSVEDGSGAQAAGIRAGDIIRLMNGNQVNSVFDFYRILGDFSKNEIMLELVRGNTSTTIGLVR
jgi:Do/DeqQ family serine protease